MAKTREIVFRNPRRKTAATPPPSLPGISRDNSLKILGVTITSHLSASDHIRQVVSGSTQLLYALCVLRHHGLTAAGLHTIFCAVVVSRLTYASPALSGFITTTDHQRVYAFLRRSKRCGFCPADLPEFGELLEKCDDQLFRKIINNPHHTLHRLLPPPSRHQNCIT